MTQSYSLVWAGHVARLFFTIGPIKFLICDVVIPVAAVDAKAFSYDTVLSIDYLHN